MGLTLVESAKGQNSDGAPRGPTTGVPALTRTNPVSPDACGDAAGHREVADLGAAGQRSRRSQVAMIWHFQGRSRP